MTDPCPAASDVSRRLARKIGASGLVAALLADALVFDARRAAAAEKLRALSAEEAASVAAIAERIWPGAGEAGALAYIDGALAQAYAKDAETYRQGLAKLDGAARQRFGMAFAQSTPEQQDQLLTALAANQLAALPAPEGQEFFELLRRHVMEGVLSDPIYGGNRDFGGWKAVGYPGPYRLYTEEDQTSFAPLDMPYQSIKDL